MIKAPADNCTLAAIRNGNVIHVLARLLVILTNIVYHTFFEKVLNHFKRDAYSRELLSPLRKRINR
ncbi:MAG TPA: hypothetical protein VN957_20055, partial [Chthoniobacterales bacterium]|nr:hypothetical protein [Chthoniobacterales bacterium]